MGIYRTTNDGLISMANEALVSMLGYTSFEELTGQNLDEEGCGPIYQREAFRAQIERDGETRGVESVWKRRDGSVLFVRENAKVVRDANGKILYFEGTVEDITERKLAEEKLQRSEAQLRSLIDNAPYGIYQSDPRSDGFLDVNPALVEMLGYGSKQELLALEVSKKLYADPGEYETLVQECRLSWTVRVRHGLEAAETASNCRSGYAAGRRGRPTAVFGWRCLSKTSPSGRSSNSSCARRRRWRRWEIWRAEWPTISITC